MRQRQECPKCRFHVQPAYYRAIKGLGNKFVVITKAKDPEDLKNSWRKELHGFWCPHCNELVFLPVYDIHRTPNVYS